MSEPEIARRCPACGAMVRMSATFCAHCGTPFQRHAAEQTPLLESNGETIERHSAIDNEETPLSFVVAKPDNVAAKRNPPPPPSTNTSARPFVTNSFATNRLDGYEAGDNRGNRNVERMESSKTGNQRRTIATNAVTARGQLEENLRPRVAKVRQTSTSVLEEAADDPGLRFVLVAAVLFLLAVVLLLFSKLLH